jgi:hypothetical protein
MTTTSGEIITVPSKVLDLVGRFDYYVEAYKQGKYNETQVRRLAESSSGPARTELQRAAHD